VAPRGRGQAVQAALRLPEQRRLQRGALVEPAPEVLAALLLEGQRRRQQEPQGQRAEEPRGARAVRGAGALRRAPLAQARRGQEQRQRARAAAVAAAAALPERADRPEAPRVQRRPASSTSCLLRRHARAPTVHHP